jgi:hypothetical protein
MLDYYHGRKQGMGALGRYLASGIYAGAPTTASSQGAGANGATAVRTNETPGFVRLPVPRFNADKQTWMVDDAGVVSAANATVDHVIVNQSNPSYCQVGQDRRFYRVVWVGPNGAVNVATVSGAAAVDGSAVYPTLAQVQSAVGGAHIPFLVLFGGRVRRTGDVVVAVTLDSTLRPLGVPRGGSTFGTHLFTAAL